jgi:TonB family protein
MKVNSVSAVLAVLIVLLSTQPRTRAQQSKDWKKFVSTEGNFSVMLPGRPSLSKKVLQSARGDIETSTYALDNNGALYTVMYLDIPGANQGPEMAKRALDAGRNNMLAKLPGLQFVSEKEISLAGNPGREHLAYDDRDVIRSRIFLVKNKLYINIFLMLNHDAIRTRANFRSADNLTEHFQNTSLQFLDSFKLLLPEAEEPGEVERMLSDLKKRNALVIGVARSDASPEKRISSDVINGKAVRLVQPTYPAIAARATGQVSVLVLIDYEGKVAAAEVKSGNPLFWNAALMAARASTFSPTIWKGQPAMVSGLIIYNFGAR